MTAVIICYFIGAVITVIGWWHGSSSLIWGDSASVFLTLGRLTGLLGFYHLLWQFLLIGRLPLFDRWLGFDRLARWHRRNAIIALTLIFVHPVCLIVAYGSFSNVSWWSQLAVFVAGGEGLTAATVSLALFGLVALSSWLSKYIIRSYERWYLVHLAVYAGILLSFGHQLKWGGDFSQQWFVLWWQIVTGVALALFVWYRLVWPLLNYRRHRFAVKEVIAEAPGVVSVIISGRQLDRFNFQPGQFAMFRFLSPKIWREAHPFSFSQTPGQNSLRITIKNLGDFTATIKNTIKPGLPLLIDGPHGNFTLPVGAAKLLLIGGGIGITPIRALAEAAAKKRVDTVVVYSTHQDSERIFNAEFAMLVAAGRIKMISHVSATAGRLSAAKLLLLVPDLVEREIFVCGPPDMNQSLRQQLLANGVPQSRFHWERFSFQSVRSPTSKF